MGDRASRVFVAVALLAGVACSGSDPAAAPASTTTTTVPDGPTAQEVLDELRADTGSPGALALVRLDGEERFVSSGTADEDGTPLSPDATFRIGSVTKTVTAALALSAVAAGELSLDTEVGALLPGVLGPPPVTVRMLLEHSSGVFNAGDEGDLAADIGRIADPELRRQAQDLAARFLGGEAVIAPDRVLVALAETHPRYFPAGTGHHYSNIGFQLLGMALPQATGAGLDALLDDRIASPLGLRRTWLAPADLTDPGVRSYTIDPGGERRDTTSELLALGNGASGGVVSTATELLDALEAIVTGGLLPRDLTEAMLAPTPESDGTYGMGVVRYELACGEFAGHDGAISGMQVHASVRLDGTASVVVAVNARGGGEADLLATAEALVCERPYAP